MAVVVRVPQPGGGEVLCNASPVLRENYRGGGWSGWVEAAGVLVGEKVACGCA